MQKFLWDFFRNRGSIIFFQRFGRRTNFWVTKTSSKVISNQFRIEVFEGLRSCEVKIISKASLSIFDLFGLGHFSYTVLRLIRPKIQWIATFQMSRTTCWKYQNYFVNVIFFLKTNFDTSNLNKLKLFWNHKRSSI